MSLSEAMPMDLPYAMTAIEVAAAEVVVGAVLMPGMFWENHG
jgi:hypothetical protein